jgi:hypothetical protein
MCFKCFWKDFFNKSAICFNMKTFFSSGVINTFPESGEKKNNSIYNLQTSQCSPADFGILLRRTSGVLPMLSKIVDIIAGFPVL